MRYLQRGYWKAAVTKVNMPKRRVLVVDDEPLVCDAVELMLRFDGHTVVTAESGAEALAALDREPFDLVITDYAMPHMKGDELARRIKARTPAMPVVMITAHAEVLTATRMPLPDIALVISKPFMLESLREAILKTCPDTVA
jgi:DNA-binding NtrC family response regulator